MKRLEALALQEGDLVDVNAPGGWADGRVRQPCISAHEEAAL